MLFELVPRDPKTGTGHTKRNLHLKLKLTYQEHPLQHWRLTLLNDAKKTCIEADSSFQTVVEP